MIVGETLTGKSTLLRTLENSYILQYQQQPKVFPNVEVKFLNPKAITLDEMYGEYDTYT